MAFFTLSNGEGLYFENATHMLVDEQPEKFAAEVAALL